MSNQKKNVWYIALLIIGAALYAAGCLEYIDSFWSGMGGALIGVSAVRLMLLVRYKKDPEYAKHVDISNEDERLRFIADKARSRAFFFSILLLATITSLPQFVHLILKSAPILKTSNSLFLQG